MSCLLYCCVKLSHLGEVDAECVRVVLPRNEDLRLRGPARPLDVGAAGERQRRLLRDQLQATTRQTITQQDKQ